MSAKHLTGKRKLFDADFKNIRTTTEVAIVQL